MMTEHPQRFRLLAKVICNPGEWPGWFNAEEGRHYDSTGLPKVVDHLPAGEWVYSIVGDGFDYLTCSLCHFRDQHIIDERRAPAA